ncbi:hypothetical protein [Nonomuraea jabiensis]|uniref:carbonic anhydrase n=1 Tax=Nonomuraea jabiensis TaxID=882448 RepID=A0A7W9LFC6_9ACTN|nr:hypothetical protein [Nonomuraea jabiensis]MBB5781750.1 carbonic anhydrase [Nonomuraea jabiensis]
MSITDELVANAERYAESFQHGALALPPAKRLAVVACMDARLNVYGLLGLREGDAHVIRTRAASSRRASAAAWPSASGCWARARSS